MWKKGTKLVRPFFVARVENCGAGILPALNIQKAGKMPAPQSRDAAVVGPPFESEHDQGGDGEPLPDFFVDAGDAGAFFHGIAGADLQGLRADVRFAGAQEVYGEKRF